MGKRRVKRTWCSQEDNFAWYIVCFQSGFKSQGDTYAAYSNEVVTTSMAHALKSVHLSIDTDCPASFEMLKLCTPGCFKAEIVRGYAETVGLHERGEEMMGVDFMEHEFWVL